MNWTKNIVFITYILFMVWELYLGRYRSPGYAGYNLTPFKTITGYFINWEYYSTWLLLVNLVGNVVVFVPMGIFISLYFKEKIHFIKVILISVAVLVPAELLQIILKVGSSDIDDIILNSLGSILGYGVYKGFRFITRYDKNAQ